MRYEEFLNFLEHSGKDPSRLVFEDDLTGLYNRRFLFNYLQQKISWDTIMEHPLSLIMIDADHFKQINDTYGHPAGDQALIRIASILKEATGDEGMVIRYAGDEFVILMPEKEKQAALELGEQLMQRIRETPLTLEAALGSLNITLSMGIASAPEDAQTGKSLIQMADTALYYAKKVGRNRLANAREVSPEDVFAKAALQQLEGKKTAGRNIQLSQVIQSFQIFEKGHSQFLIIEGDAGMGKSTFLETILAQVAPDKEMSKVKAKGKPQELFRPYYLITDIIVELLNQREDKGVPLLDELNPDEMTYLSHILPQLKDKEEGELEEDEREQRKTIFNTILHFIPKILDSRPFMAFIDDLQYADEASLLLLRRLKLYEGLTTFICSTSIPIERLKTEEEKVPFSQFYETYRQELNMSKISLTPLTASDISDHLQGIFPQVDVPENFEKNLAQITQGNPFFLSEILRKLALDQKIPLRGQRWSIEPLEEGYLPDSPDEMISQKIDSLDEESRQLLYRAATFGEDVSLSLLSGSSEEREAKILEFVDQAYALGLLLSDFKLNDENIRFLGKRILEKVYESIQPDQKQELHEKIGNYQETLYQQRLIPFAANLAYHFKRSTNQEKASLYEKNLEEYADKIFNASEATQYTGERRKAERRKQKPGELPPPGTPLDPEDLAKVPAFIRYLLAAARHIKLYPMGSEAVVSAILQLKEAVDSILDSNESVSVFQINQVLMVNGQKIDVSEFKLLAEELVKFMMSVELKGIIFHKGLTSTELEALVEAFGRPKEKVIDKDFWQNFSKENKLKRIELKQVQYTLMVDSSVPAEDRATPDGTIDETSTRISYQKIAREQKLDPEDLTQIQKFIKSLLGAAKNIKLYPIESNAISTYIKQLIEVLRNFFKKQPILTLANISNSLLVNGVSVDKSKMGTSSDSFLKFLDSLMLSSLTFLEFISEDELKTFVGELGKLPTSGLDSNFWQKLAKDKEFSAILFDKVLYEPWVTSSQAASAQVQPQPESEGEFFTLETDQPITEELLDPFLKETPDRVADLLSKNDEKQILQVFRQLFLGFQDRPAETRGNIIQNCQGQLDNQTLAFQAQLSKILSEPLLSTISEEKDPNILRNIASLLYNMVTYLIQFAEYTIVSQILTNLCDHQQKLLNDKDTNSQRLGKILDTNLEATTQKLLMNDLKSNETSRQQGAAQILGSLGQWTVPLLIDIIKREEDLRIREIAASLLKEMGQEPVDLLKRELVLESAPRERLRILEVIDTVTKDLKTEIVFAFSDKNPEVRRASFQLAERLGGSDVIKLLLDYAKSKNTDLAVGAIKSLGKLKSLAAVEVLVPILNSSNNKKRLIACCESLGQIGSVAGIEPLIRILMKKGSFFRRKRKSAEVRATAAFALSQITHPRAAKVLAGFADDRNSRIREVAQNFTKTANSLT